MGFSLQPKSFMKKYILAVVKDDPRGYVYTSSVSIRFGIVILEVRKNEYLVVRYPVLILFGIITIFSLLIDHILDFSDARMFSKILDYNYSGGSALFAYTLKIKQADITVFSQILDKWWYYPFLEQEQEQLKEELQRKLKKFNHFYNKFYRGRHFSVSIWNIIGLFILVLLSNNVEEHHGVRKSYFTDLQVEYRDEVEVGYFVTNPIMVVMGIGFGMMPFGRYFYETEKSSKNLLLLGCWSPFPLDTWWGFSITYWIELTTILSLFYSWAYIVSFLILVMETIGKQLQLIGISLVTAEDRVLKLTGLLSFTGEKEWYESYVRLLEQELKNSIMHYQKIQRLSKEACSLFSAPINICFSSGILAIVVSCAKLATERDNKFVIFQAIVMVVNVLVNQFIVSCINQILTDQMDNLRGTIYDTPWYKLPIPCRKTINMMQVMLLRPPSIRTVLGTKTDMEFFATVVNTSYFYLGALLSTNVKY